VKPAEPIFDFIKLSFLGNSHYQKADFGARNVKIGFIIRISEFIATFDNIKIKLKKKKHRDYCDASSLAL
jgi:hypothetical protein